MGRVARQIIDGKLVCYHCKVNKPTEDFSRKSDSPCGRHSICRVCQKVYSSCHQRTREQNKNYAARWQSANREHYRAYQAAYHRGYRRIGGS